MGNITQDFTQLARTCFSPKWLRLTVAILAQAASYCPTHPHLYRYLGRRLGRYTFLQPLLSIRPGEGVQVSGGTWCPRKHVPPLSNFPGRCRGFSPLVFVTRGFSPLWPSSPYWTCTFFGQREKGNPPLFEIPFTSQVLTLHLSSGWE